jgi:dinuclear metal center YbgI/SA1388 family protein
MHSFTLWRMKKPRLSDVVGIINKKYSFALAEQWDNVGLQIGSPSEQINKIMVALDPLPAVLDEAISLGCNLLVTHHPLIFTPVRQISSSTVTGSSILKAIQAGLAVVSMHTNYDIAQGGLNDLLADRMGLNELRPLKIIGHEELVKLVVFVPAAHHTAVRSALFPYAVQIGNYRDCSFSTPGQGTFLPLAGAQPAVGAIGSLEQVEEVRLELLVHKSRLGKVIKTLLSAHPYEEPAFDCYPLINESVPIGLGRIGRLPEPVTLQAYAAATGARLGCGSVRMVGDPARLIRTVALCSGSGASLLVDAVRAGADLLVTGDVKYHEARDAETQGIALLDAGHFATEQLMVAAIRDFLTAALGRSGFLTEVCAAQAEYDPFTTVITNVSHQTGRVLGGM